ncbi:MAG TPA: mannose-1-phosphate guanylyltransferase/mannose-6-phosphate isomerase [Synergistaceae bacterium]|nr:mannose-1-phosphate guanylyltransferase/mannose-6-phosphate isomerase [Synergistaceae bacterium]
MKKQLHALILAGGGGTRLWPLSREEVPKQFLPLEGKESLLQQTFRRLLPLCGSRIRIVAGERWKSQILHQALQIGLEGEDFFLAEPRGRNTAPAIALALAALLEEGLEEHTPLLVCPSDHAIKDEKAFLRAVEAGFAPLEEGRLVTFGVVPSVPETGFGYIRTGSSRGEWSEVEAFVEKPDAERARTYLDSGRYLWNGGIFLFRLGDMAAAYDRHLPQIGQLIRRGTAALKEAFSELSSLSVDVGIMEKAEKVGVVPLDAGWTDLGSWDALYNYGPLDEEGNLLEGDVLALDCRNSLIRGKHRLIAASGIENMLVVDTPDALYLAPRGKSQEVRKVVEHLKAEERRELWQAPESARSWGEYRILYEGEGIKVKRLRVFPSRSLSLQYHHHRCEHWIVVSGTARVRHGEEEYFLHEGQSTFIGKHQVHQLSNPGKLPLEIIEVQNGPYLGEDDILRYGDEDYRPHTKASPEKDACFGNFQEGSSERTSR